MVVVVVLMVMIIIIIVSNLDVFVPGQVSSGWLPCRCCTCAGSEVYLIMLPVPQAAYGPDWWDEYSLFTRKHLDTQIYFETFTVFTRAGKWPPESPVPQSVCRYAPWRNDAPCLIVWTFQLTFRLRNWGNVPTCRKSISFWRMRNTITQWIETPTKCTCIYWLLTHLHVSVLFQGTVYLCGVMAVCCFS
jgi:hypothetical protein